MAYTSIPAFTDTVATTSEFNTYIRDNQRALKDPPSANFEANESSDYSGIVPATYTSVDATSGKFTQSITTTGGDVICCVVFNCFSTNTIQFDLDVDGTRIGTDGGTNGSLVNFSSATPLLFTFNRLIVGLSAGTHTIALQWRQVAAASATLYAGAGTANYDLHPQMWVRELT